MFGNEAAPPAMVCSVRLETKLSQQHRSVSRVWKQNCPSSNGLFGTSVHAWRQNHPNSNNLFGTFGEKNCPGNNGTFGNKTAPTAIVCLVCFETKLSQQQWSVCFVWQQSCPNNNGMFLNKAVPTAIMVCLEAKRSQ